MATSRLLVFRSSPFHLSKALPSSSSPSVSSSIHALRDFSCPSLQFLSSFKYVSKFQNKPTHLQKFSIHSDSTVIKDSTENRTESVPLGVSHPWPEWVSFMDRLKDKGYFGRDSPKKEVGCANTEGAIPKDLNLVQSACLSFARERFDILRSLSKKDVQAVVECGCPNLFQKAVNSAKRLRAYVKLDEGDVCSTCNLRGSCDRAYIIAKDDDRARTVDVVRILLSHAMGPLVLSGEKHPGKVNVEASARKLLSELIEMSDTPFDPALPKLATRSSSKTKPSKKVTVAQDNVEMMRGDWICSKCNFMNFARNIRCLECKEDGPKRVNFDDVEMKRGDWTCPQCQFMNFARNTKCFRCQESRPKRQQHPGEWECPSCNFTNFARNSRCKQCNEDWCIAIGSDDAEIKGGDWRCPQCRFINFARKKECLRCQESRPKRQLNQGEWECPSCDFLNYRRNMSCLKCKSDRPKDTILQYEGYISRKPTMGGQTRSRYDGDCSGGGNSDGGGSGGSLDGLISDEYCNTIPGEGQNKVLISTGETPPPKRTLLDIFQQDGR